MYEFRRHKVCIVRIPTFHECNFPLFPHTGRLTVGSQTSRHENHPPEESNFYRKKSKEQKRAEKYHDCACMVPGRSPTGFVVPRQERRSPAPRRRRFWSGRSAFICSWTTPTPSPSSRQCRPTRRSSWCPAPALGGGGELKAIGSHCALDLVVVSPTSRLTIESNVFCQFLSTH